jgi:hypothetical protein
LNGKANYFSFKPELECGLAGDFPIALPGRLELRLPGRFDRQAGERLSHLSTLRRRDRIDYFTIRIHVHQYPNQDVSTQLALYRFRHNRRGLPDEVRRAQRS